MKVTLTIRRPDDWHVHLRNGLMLDMVVKHTAQVFARGLVMPNLTPPIKNQLEAENYRREIMLATNSKWLFQPLMTIKLKQQTTPDIIRGASVGASVIAAKLYPIGMTTNAEDGIDLHRIEELYPVFCTMEEVGMVLCWHAEMHGVFSLDREASCLDVISKVCQQFPGLKHTIEHITTKDAVEMVASNQNIAATITAHHLCETLDSIIGDKLETHLFCKPVPKRPEDRLALINAAISGHPRYFFGSDSAPHKRTNKECARGCAGVFSAPVAMPILAQVFEENGALDNLEAFVSEFGAQWYNMPLNSGTVTLEQKLWRVPRVIADVVPYRADQDLSWKVTRVEY